VVLMGNTDRLGGLNKNGCYRYECNAGVDPDMPECKVCHWTICNSVSHVIQDHSRCAEKWSAMTPEERTMNQKASRRLKREP